MPEPHTSSPRLLKMQQRMQLNSEIAKFSDEEIESKIAELFFESFEKETDNRPPMKNYQKQKYYTKAVTPYLKEFAYRWWKYRYVSEKPNKAYKPGKLFQRLKTLSRGKLSDTHLLTLMNQQKAREEKERLSTSQILLLQQLLKNGESGRVEAKKSIKQKEDIGKTSCAFANKGGGVIVIGVYESAKVKLAAGDVKINETFALCGVSGDIDSERLELTRYLASKLTLDIQRLSFEFEDVANRKVLLVRIPGWSLDQHELFFFNEEAYIREDNHNRKLSAKEVYTFAKTIFLNPI